MKKYLIKFSLITSVVLGLFALWTLCQVTPVSAATYTISFNASGGIGTMPSQAITSGVAVTLKSNTFTKVGYSFTGWAITSKGPVVYSDGASYQMRRAGNVTLYAVWKSACTYNIIFNANGGTREMPAKEMIIGISENLPMNKFIKRSQTFRGWALTSGANETVTYTDGSPYVRNFYDTKDVTLYAVWTKAPYTITFNANGGTGTALTQSIVSGEKDFLKLNTYQKEGYRFDGWATKATGNVVYQDGVIYTMGTSNVTLYARWTQLAVDGYIVAGAAPYFNGFYPYAGVGAEGTSIYTKTEGGASQIIWAYTPGGGNLGGGGPWVIRTAVNPSQQYYRTQGYQYFTGVSEAPAIPVSPWYFEEGGISPVTVTPHFGGTSFSFTDGSTKYATTSLGWNSFLKLLQMLR
jgi:uncharacterized repeat protein (TIGR02543 family)